jgi:hypothetical protein
LGHLLAASLGADGWRILGLGERLREKFNGTIFGDGSKNLLFRSSIAIGTQGNGRDLLFGDKVSNKLLGSGIKDIDEAVTIGGEERTFTSGLCRGGDDGVDGVAHGRELDRRLVGVFGIY